MKKIIVIVLFLPGLMHAWDFIQERATIPVSYDGVECQVPWTTGYNYIHPVFIDIDSDNDYDLVFGSDWARLSLYSNIGTSNIPDLQYITDSLVTLPDTLLGSQQSNRPAFCDIDNDGDFDLFVGLYLGYPINYGRLYFYRNTGNNINPQFTLEEEYYQGINYHNEQYASFVDIDNDGDFDLFIGLGHHWNPTDGRIAFYENTGTSEIAIMDSVTSFFMEIDIGDDAIPAFIDIDNDDDYDMLLGDGDGNIWYYRNDGTPEVYDFVFVTNQYAGINVANIASPAFTDIDGDGDYDLFVGERSWGQDNRRGDINFYENTGTPDSAVFELITQNFLSLDIGNTAPVAFADIDNNGLVDMFVGDLDGNINYFSNTGSEHSPYFTFVTETFEGIAANYQSRPTFGDLDNDGDLDLIVGRVYYNTGSVYLYCNIGNVEDPEFELINSNYLGINYQNPEPNLIDLDNDNDLDLLVGHAWNQVIYWKNEGTPEFPNFVLENSNLLNTPYEGDFCFITLGDIDSDNDYDLIRGHYDYTIDLYLNVGTPENPEYILAEEEFLGIYMTLNPEPTLVDIDTDGDLDLFVGDFCGGVSFWRNNEVSVVDPYSNIQPYTFTLLQNYPNPFNSSTTISFELRAASQVKLAVYNILGQEVWSLDDMNLEVGEHRVIWDAVGMASGLYIIKLKTSHNENNIQTILIK